MARKRNKRAAAKPTVATDPQFEHELEVFRTEAETAAQFFYGYLAIPAAGGAVESYLSHSESNLLPFARILKAPVHCIVP
jgi:hypothetical protein